MLNDIQIFTELHSVMKTWVSFLNNVAEVNPPPDWGVVPTKINVKLLSMSTICNLL